MRRPRVIARGVVLTAAAGLVTALALLAAPAAKAGEYTVYTCRLPDGSSAGIGAWQVTEGEFPAKLSSWETCPEGGYQISMSSKTFHPADHFIRTSFVAPTGTEISAYSIWRNSVLSPEYNYRYYEIVDDDRVIHDRCYDDCVRRGSWDAHVSPRNLVSRSGLRGVTGLQFGLTCGLPDGSSDRCPAGWPAARLAIHRADITLRDETDPVIEGVTGTLVEASGQVLSGRVPVSISASDQGGGVYQAVFVVDGKERGRATIDENNGSCATPFTTAQPCPATAGGTVSFNTRKVADGPHELRIAVTDATGDNTASWGPVSIRTENGRCSPAPRSKELRLRARIAGRRGGRTATAGYRERPRVKGRLTTPSGEAVARAKICVSSRAQMRNAGLEAEGSVRTNDRGRFSYRLQRGPSRRVYFVNRASQGAVSDRVKVRVHAPVRMRPSQRKLVNGQTLTLSGRLRAGPLPRRGAIVEVQAARGNGWQTFGTARTNRNGRYRFRYRFTRTVGVQLYELRARVPAQATYPYAPGASKPATVRVAG